MTPLAFFLKTGQPNKNNMKKALSLLVGVGFAFLAQPAKAADGMSSAGMMEMMGTTIGMTDFPMLYEGTGIVKNVKLTGRLHAQYNYVESEVDDSIRVLKFDKAQDSNDDLGDDDLTESTSNGDSEESTEGLRRLRVGVKAHLFDNVKVKATANFNSSKDDFKAEYKSFDEAHLTYTTGNGIDLSIGRVKSLISPEGRTSSNNLMTVERSQISNLVYNSARPTAVRIGGLSFGDLEGSFTIASNEDKQDSGVWSSYGEGVAFSTNLTYNGLAMPINLDVLINEEEDDYADIFGYEYAASLDFTIKTGKLNTLFNFIYGEGDAIDEFYGLVILPSFWLVEDKVKAVFRFTYADADADVFRTAGSESGLGLTLGEAYEYELGTDREPANDETRRSVASVNEAGDEYYSIYAGLCFKLGNKGSIVTGIEYEDLTKSSDENDEDALSFRAVYRYSF